MASRNEDSHIKPPKEQKSGCGTFILMVIGFILIVTLAFNLYQKQTKIHISDDDLISLPGHPKLYDDFEKTRKFYSKFYRKKTKMLNRDNTRGPGGEEKEFIYMENSSTNYENYPDIITEVYINFSNSKIDRELTLDEVVSIAVDYLPMDLINQYYDFNRAFIHGNDDDYVTYHYSWELNDAGIDYDKNSNPAIWDDFGFIIGHNKVNNTFTIRICYWAEELGYFSYNTDEEIEEITEKWEINLEDYYTNSDGL